MARAKYRRWLAAVVGMGLSVAGCGSTAHKSPVASATAVIRAWSTALRRGDVDLAARYFALPSEFVNGPGDAVSIHTEAQARAVNATLPCGALLISTMQQGRFVSALFRLTKRPGPDAGCGSGTGQLARTNFIIAGGRILDWIRAPETPGPTGPSTSTGPVV